MMDITRFKGPRFVKFTPSQDIIEWRRFVEGVISKAMLAVQKAYYDIQGGTLTPEAWAKGVVKHLLKVTHGQWLYWSVQVHDIATRVLATRRKEALQMELKTQIELGGEDWTRK